MEQPSFGPDLANQGTKTPRVSANVAAAPRQDWFGRDQLANCQGTLLGISITTLHQTAMATLASNQEEWVGFIEKLGH
jgi:hypothetical protein